MRRLILLFCASAMLGCSTWPEIEITEPQSVYTRESGASLEISVALSHRPMHAIDVWAVSSTPSEARVSGRLRFRRSNWDDAQQITVTGVDDDVCDGDRAYGVSIYARWHDDPSAEWLVDELYFINRDDDCTTGSATGEARDE